MQPSQFASAGNAIERGTAENPIGLYFDKESKTYIGCIDPIQADAAVRVGYVLVKQAKNSTDATEMSKEVNLPGAKPVEVKPEVKNVS